MKWIDVTKKPPPLNVPILVANRLFVDGNLPEWIQCVFTAVIVEEFTPGYGNITHWMPKPLPPKLSKRYFINLAKKQGIELTRYDRDRIHVNFRDQPSDMVPWLEACCRHKRELLKHLPDYQRQTNLFDACQLNPTDYFR